MSAIKLAECLPDSIARLGAAAFVTGRKALGRETLTFEYGGRLFRFRADKPIQYSYLHDAIQNGKTGREKVPLSYLKTGDCHDALIDVGAHFGLYSVILGVLNPELPLYSFEPSPYNAEICRENIEANHIDGEVFEAAVGRSNSRAQLNMRTRPGNGLQFFNSTIAHSIVTEKEDMKDDSSVTVPTRALSSFCAEQGICHPFVKIDAEGAEHRIVNDLLNEADIDGISGIVELHPDLIPDSEGYAHEILFWFEQEGIDFECVKSHNPSRPAYYFTT